MPDGRAEDRVTAVIVTFNSGAVVAECLGRLASVGKVVVVDNGSADDTLAMAERARPGVVVVRNGSNLGYGAAANRGLARVATEYGLLITPDALLAPGALPSLVAAADRWPDAAVVAPLLFDARDRLDLAVMGPREHNHRPAGWRPEAPFCTWFVTGAVWLVRLAAWRAVGGFDEAIFLYNDDADLCLRMRRAGFALVVLPEAAARHLGGRSTPPSRRVRWLKDRHMTWSHLYLERKHGDPRAAGRLAWRQAVGFALRALLYALLLRPGKVAGNLAKASGAFAFLRGRSAR
jgi:GT2 family glycosyltransferase